MPTEAPSRTKIAAESRKAVIREFARIVALNAAIRLSPETSKIKAELAHESSSVFAKEINTDPDVLDMPIAEAIKAADYSDPNLSVGLLSGSLVLQRALTLMHYEYPVLGSVFTDFSPEPGQFKQTTTTRIVLKPAVQSYDNTLDNAGRAERLGNGESGADRRCAGHAR